MKTGTSKNKIARLCAARLAVLLLCAFLAGCSRGESTQTAGGGQSTASGQSTVSSQSAADNKSAAGSPAPVGSQNAGAQKGRGAATSDAVMSVYYIDKNGTTIAARQVEIPAYAKRASDPAQYDVRDVITEVLQLMTQPAGTVDLVPVIQSFAVEEWRCSDAAVTLQVSPDYYRLDTIREILVRAALVNTLCGIDGVDSVSILCGDAPLTDNRGVPLGPMNASMFLMEDENMRLFTTTRLHLYFADETGTKLIDTYRNIAYNSNISMPRLVAEQVIKGPNGDLIYPTLSSEVRVLSTSVRDGICYLDLDSAFLSQPNKVTQHDAIYSLVNSLTELPGVRRVQLSVDGSTAVTFMDSISLQNYFERDLSLMYEGAADR